jgi:hypothetical protein
MSNRLLLMAALLVSLCIPLAAQTFSFGTGDATLDVTLNSLNVQAKADIGPFTAELSASFGVAQPQIQSWITVEKLQPAEAYLVLELGKVASKPPATVLAAYKANKAKGWGAVAKALGIKPGSAEFKALKAATVEKDKKVKARKKK